jgi:hypothetical protein
VGAYQSPAVGSLDGDVSHVDGDQQRCRLGIVVALGCIGASLGGNDDAADVAVVGGVEFGGRPGYDVDGEVMAAKEAVGAEADFCLRVWLLMSSGKVTSSRRHVSPPTSIGVISSVTKPGHV